MSMRNGFSATTAPCAPGAEPNHHPRAPLVPLVALAEEDVAMGVRIGFAHDQLSL
jgi:hypothetical protein